MNKPQYNSNVVDALSRPIRDLRISVIDNCNMRCTYCMPGDEYGEHYKFLSSDDLLSYDEITRLARIFVGLGVSKIRLTGGEPLLRRGLPQLIASLNDIDGIKDIALTTNALLLRRQALALREAGLSRITVSLDSLNPEIFRKMTGRNLAVANVLDGIRGAREAGFDNIKINTVVQGEVNEDSVLDLVRYSRDNDLTVRFIEYMDVGNRNRWRVEDVVPSATLLKRIHAQIPLRPLEKQYDGEVASRYGFLDGSGEIGFITSITEPFCGSCTRARLSADGKLYTCLFATSGSDLRTPMRSGENNEKLRNRVSAIWMRREDRYSELRDSLLSEGDEPKVEMYHIGG